ncbi:amidohydrolase family protein [Rhodohalobacter sp. 614A]|uniref:amidohydrolase family protein n=1 Tax=Rhodohalobacter sp. 614A TaxID=2908649 RepID=UPI001F43DF5A|nr:amidohydrolase family protein [Rhodohalobacter sp. 614A]
MSPSGESLYNEIPKIDAHIHQNVKRSALLDIAKKEGFRLLSINTEIPDFPQPNEQQNIVLDCKSENPDRINFITTFTTENWGETGWQDQAIEQIQEGRKNGAVAVKIWKNIGMDLQDKDGNFVMADHKAFNPIYEYLVKEEIPLAAHLGEPKNCWLPVEEMTVDSDRDYFSKNPQYHMFLHKEFPSYQDQIQARDNVLEKHPDLKFIGLHLASLEWSVRKVGSWLNRFPNAVVDLAERVCHLQYQAIDHQSKVKEFVETHQDRIIYGSDQIDDGLMAASDIQNLIRSKWTNEFEFFASGTVQSAWNVSQPFKGLGLKKEILEKIFHDNAIRYYPRLEIKN